MDRSEALRVLGVDERSSREEVRAAYVRLVRGVHPDAGADTGADVALVVEAYRIAARPRAGPDDAEDAVNPVDLGGDAFLLELPADEAFLVVQDAAFAIGDVAYVDPESGILEVFVDGASLVVTLQGRAALGGTEVFWTVTPPAAGPVERLAAAIGTFPA